MRSPRVRWSRVAAAASIVCLALLAAAPNALAGLHWSRPSRIAVRPHGIPVRATAVSCPSVELCVAVGEEMLAVSTDPAKGAQSWQLVSAPPPSCTKPQPDGFIGCPGAWTPFPAMVANSISCPTVSLCVAAGSGSGDAILTSTDPTGGSDAWTVHRVGKGIRFRGARGIRGVSCTAAPMCVGITGTSDLLTSTDPGGGAKAWKRTDMYPYKPTRGTPNGVSCAVGICAVAGESGYLLTARNPLLGLGGWRGEEDIASWAPLSGVTCASRKLCIAYGYSLILTSTNPARGARHWKAEDIFIHFRHSANLIAGSCTPHGFCVVGGRSPGGRVGTIFINSAVSRHPGKWRAARIDKTLVKAISCPSSALCVALDSGGRLLTGTRR